MGKSYGKKWQGFMTWIGASSVRSRPANIHRSDADSFTQVYQGTCIEFDCLANGTDGTHNGRTAAIKARSNPPTGSAIKKDSEELCLVNPLVNRSQSIDESQNATLTSLYKASPTKKGKTAL